MTETSQTPENGTPGSGTKDPGTNDRDTTDRGNDDRDTKGSDTPDPGTNRAAANDQIRARSMQRVVLRKSLRRRRARLENEDSVWVWLGTFGLVGWTVMVPTLAGLAFGIFLDGRVDASVSFTITFLIVGVAVGGSMAWYWVRQRSERGGES